MKNGARVTGHWASSAEQIRKAPDTTNESEGRERHINLRFADLLLGSATTISVPSLSLVKVIVHAKFGQNTIVLTKSILNPQPKPQN